MLAYEGEDIPTMLPLEETKVRMVVHETVRFNESLPEGRSEWNYLFTPGGGAYVVGDQQRFLINAMYHQLHCLERLSYHIRHTKPEAWSHVRHCLEYLLAASLCESDLTLEPGDFTENDFSVDRIGVERVCKDWES